MKSIGILNLTRFGDLVQTTPLLAGLRKRHPTADIHLIVKKRFRAVADMLPGVTRIHEIDGAAIASTLHDNSLSFVERFRRVRALLESLEFVHFDLLLNLTHSRSSAVLLSLLDAERTLGYAIDREGHRVVESPWLSHVSTIVRARRLMRFNLVDVYLGATGLLGCGEPLAVHIPTEARSFAEERLPDRGRRVAVQLGASQDTKTWPVARWASTLRALHARLPDLRVLLVGVAAEAAQARALVSACPDLRFEDLVGQTDVPQLAAALERARLLLTADTGTMHLAAAVGTPICSVFVGVGNPYETAPYGEGHWVVHSRVACAPCRLDLRCGHPICHDDVPEDWLAELAHRIVEHDAPESIAPLPRADLLRTRFDENGLLELAPVHVRPSQPHDLMALAYQAVFLETLAQKPMPRVRTWRRAERFHGVGAQEWRAALPGSVIPGLRETERLAREGEAATLDLGTAGDSAPALRAAGAEIAGIDARILEICRAQPLLAPLALAFEVGIESLPDGDLDAVAHASAEEYRRLRRRALMLREITEGHAFHTDFLEGVTA